jgi:hypothetical protein
VQFGYGLNYLIDIDNAVIVDVEATPARTYDEVAATNDARPHRGPLRSEAEASRSASAIPAYWGPNAPRSRRAILHATFTKMRAMWCEAR